jgi:hypothetical protein
MAQFKVIGVAQRTSVGVQAYTGVGFQPTGLIAFGNNRTSDGGHADAVLSMGAGKAVDQGRADFVLEQDGVSPTNVAWRRQTADAFWSIDSVTPTTLAEAEIDSLDADGFTLGFDVADATARIINVLAIRGVNCAVGSAQNPASAGDKIVSGLGFQPTCVIFLQQGFTTSDPSSANGNTSGFIGFSSGPNKNRCCYWRVKDNLAAADSSRVWFDDACMVNMSTLGDGGVTPQVKAVMKSFDAGGFTLFFPDTIGTHFYHWIAFDGIQARIGTFQQPAAPGAQPVTGVGSLPAALILISSNTVNGSGVNTGDAVLSLGMASGPSDRACCWFGDQNGANPAAADSDLDRTKVIKLIAPNSLTVQGAADLTSFDADGFTLNWSVSDGVARNILYLALAATPPTPAVQNADVLGKMVTKTRRLRYRPVPTKATVADRTNDAGDVINLLLVDPEA